MHIARPQLSAAVATVFALCAVATCQLSCDSQLRLLPQFSHLFTHCDCTYREWGEWIIQHTEDVPVSQCPSGKAITEQRWKLVASGDCNPLTEIRTVCKWLLNAISPQTLWSFYCPVLYFSMYAGEPELIDQLILSLGLGSSGRHITPELKSAPYYTLVLDDFISSDINATSTASRYARSNCEASLICNHVTVPHGKDNMKNGARV